MDRLNIRHYLWVVGAGVFCWLNTSVVSAETATDLDCNGCVGPREIAGNAVGWYDFSYAARVFLINQANDVNNAVAQVNALVAQNNALLTRVATLEATVATLTGTTISGVALPSEIDLVETSE